MFYVTTPIYYVNDEPHLGHAYTTVLADTLARFHRLMGEQVFFLTGVDEHGQKVQNALKKRGLERPTNEQAQAYVDEMAARFRTAWDRLHIAPDDFIRTTEPRHVRVVEDVLNRLWEAGLIYRSEYQGWYCVPDERFWTSKDLEETDGQQPVCPECGRPLEQITESNYFFKMGQYQETLVTYIQEHPDFIQPAYRRNETLGFLRKPLGDLCISRPASRLSWGIPLPFDPEYVTYVWFDALLNYVTGAGYGVSDETFGQRWKWEGVSNVVHLIGKDILTTHTVYWPTMLLAAGLPLPKTVFAHGWWVIGGIKMSKSLGNAVRPLDLTDIYGVDAFRFFLMRDMTPGQDADFDEDRLAARYNADLANNFGNLLHRVTSMTTRYCGAVSPHPGQPGEAEQALQARFVALPGEVFSQVERFQVNAALGLVLDALSEVNSYLERTAPWTQYKQGNISRVETILYTAGEALRLASILLSPALPDKTTEVWSRLGWSAPTDLRAALEWGAWKPGSQVTVGEALFPRRE